MTPRPPQGSGLKDIGQDESVERNEHLSNQVQIFSRDRQQYFHSENENRKLS